jgi:hypothetical protein
LFAYRGILIFVPSRTCTVSFTGIDGLRHSVNVQAETLYEAVALAVRAFREPNTRRRPMSAFEVRSPSVTHTVTMRKIEDWLRSSAKSPADRIVKERLKGMMAS